MLSLFKEIIASCTRSTYVIKLICARFCNITKQNEVFINEVSARAVILSDGTVDHLTTSIKVEIFCVILLLQTLPEGL